MSQKAAAVVKSPELASPGESRRVAQRPAAAPILQHGIGNRALSQVLGSGTIQAKLAVGAEDDALEREADRVAEGVDRKPPTDISRAPTSVVQRQAAPPPTEEHEPLFAVRSDPEAPVTVQKKSAGGMQATGGRTQALLTSLPSGGVPLGETLRSDMEQQIGADFSAVRIHVDATSSRMNRDLNAHAFTHGSDIYFGQGKFDAASSHGRRLLAHELTHVVQQGGSRRHELIQRDSPAAGQTKDPAVAKYTYHVLVPASAQSIEEVERFFERFVFGREINAPWDILIPGTTIGDIRGKVIYFTVPKILVDSDVKPDKDAQEKAKKEYGKLPGKNKAEIDAEVDKRYRAASGDKPGTKLKEKDKGDKKAWGNKLDEVLKEKQTLKELPPEIKDLLGPEATYKPEDYEHLLKIVEKLKTLSKEDLAAFKLLSIRASTDLDKFEKAVDMFIARKEELKKALEAELQKKQAPAKDDKAQDKEPSLDDVFNDKLKDVDAASLGKLSDSEKYDLARKKTSELTAAQLKYMKDHPGETLKDFAKSATLVNTPDTFKGIGKDLQEAASGDANGWARFAAGTGAGAKLSGWLLAVAGVLFVASWLTGVGELATIAAAAGYLLAGTLVLSGAESELRIKAASQATTPEEFDRNIKLAAEARTTLILGVALVVIALLLHFTAKALFPDTVKKISTSLKNFREKIRLRGSVDSLKPAITTEMGTLKGELTKSVAAAKQKAVAAGEALEKLSTEEFVDKLESGDSGGYLDSSKAAPGDKVNFRELLKTPEGRAAIEDYKAKLVDALKTEVPAEIDRLGQEYGSKIDDFLKEVDAAKNHDDLSAAADKVEGALTDEHLKKFLEGEQAKVTQQKLEQAEGRAKADLDAAKAKADADAKAKADADAKAGAGDPTAKADADAKAEAAKKAAAPPVNDAYSQFSAKNKISDATTARMRDARVAISRVEELIKSGEAAESAAELAIHEADLAKALEAAKLAKGNKALQLARWATEAGIVERVQRLLAYAARSLYGNLRVLPKLIEIIAKGSRNHIQAMDDALERMGKGHLVDIEAEADVVDRTTRQAIQHKKISQGTDPETLKDNLRSALKQLSGKGAPEEKPQPGYKRVADLRITKPENPQFNADGPALEKYLKERKALSDKVGTDPDADPNAGLEGLSSDLVVRITNAKGTFIFTGPDFDLVTK
jgi:hypothetical protein